MSASLARNAGVINTVAGIVIAASITASAAFAYTTQAQLSSIATRQKSYNQALTARKKQINHRWDRQNKINNEQNKRIYNNSSRIGVMQNRIDNIEK